MVFHAEDGQLRRQVALKIMKPVSENGAEARLRFLRQLLNFLGSFSANASLIPIIHVQVVFDFNLSREML